MCRTPTSRLLLSTKRPVSLPPSSQIWDNSPQKLILVKKKSIIFDMSLYRTKRNVLFFLLLVLVAGLISCGKKQETEGGDTSASASSQNEGSSSDEGEIQNLSAAAVELPEGDENGPHPENVIDVAIERGEYRLPKFEEDPGFTHVDVPLVTATSDMKVLGAMMDKADPVGLLEKGDVFSILSEEPGGWKYIESGKVRGFLKEPGWINLKQEDPDFAEIIAPSYKNNAFLYKKITTQENPAPVILAISRIKDLKIREERSTEARVVGTLGYEGTAYILEDCDEEWVYVESGYVRGFAEKKDLLTGERAEARMREDGSWAHRPAVAEVLSSENRATYYTCTSVEPGRSVDDQMWEYMQVLGHDRTGELKIPETFNGRRVGRIYSCTPDYGTRDWLYEAQNVWRLWRRYGSEYRENIAVIGDYYLIACAPTFGNVGDYVTFYLDDDTPLHCIIADEKSSGDAKYTSYGHIHDNDIDVIEAETLYAINPGHEGCAPSWAGHRVCSCVNHGQFHIPEQTAR